MTEADVRKTKGFSLMELMIAMAILTIIATIAVPRVQVWNARNRGLQAVMELLSDFSKARSVAGYTIVGNDGSDKIEIPVDVDNPTGDKMAVYMGLRRQTAMVFRKSEYGIYQKQSMSATWSNANSSMLKNNKLLNTVTVEKINSLQTPTDTSSFDILLNFTSNGKIKNKNGAIISSGQASDQCGTGDNKKITLKQVVFSAVLRSKISLSGDDSIWYRVNIDQRGDYTICTLFSSSTTIPGDSDFQSGDFLDI